MSRSSFGVVLGGLPARGRSVTFPVWRKRCISRTMILFFIYSPTKVKYHLTCFNNIFSNNELISNRFPVFVTCTHILTYLWNRLLINFYLCVYDRVCKVPRVLFATFLVWLIVAAPYQTNRKWNLKLYTKKVSFRSQTHMLKSTRGTLHTLSYTPGTHK
jgi:hypothetical protein